MIMLIIIISIITSVIIKVYCAQKFVPLKG